MRQYIFASHAHFATGIKESTELLSGARDNVHDRLSMFVGSRTEHRRAEGLAQLLRRPAFDPRRRRNRCCANPVWRQRQQQSSRDSSGRAPTPTWFAQR
ncbi:MAG: hypothetical protein ACLTHL_01175 [Collinsella sp.]